MGTDSRVTRSGQNSSGKRTTRSIAKAPTNPRPLASPTISRPRPTRQHTTAAGAGAAAAAAAAAAPSVRGVTSCRATPKRRLPPSPPRRQTYEAKIFDEIVVTTDAPDGSDLEMSEDVAEGMGKAEASSEPDFGSLESSVEIGHLEEAHAKEAPLQMAPKHSMSAGHGGPESTDEKAPINTAVPDIDQTRSPRLPPLRVSHSVSPQVHDVREAQSSVDDAAQESPLKAEALIKSAPEEKASTEPVPDRCGPTKSETLASDITVTKTESVEKQPLESDSRYDTLQSPPPVQQHLARASSFDTATNDSAADRSPPGTSRTAAAEAEIIKPKKSQLDSERNLTQTEELVHTKIESYAPAIVSNTAMQNIDEPEAAIGHPDPDESSAFDDAIQTDVVLAPRVKLAALGWESECRAPFSDPEENFEKGMTQSTAISLTFHDPVTGQMEKELRIPPSVIPRLNSSSNDSLPCQGPASGEAPEEEGTADSPSQESGSMDLDEFMANSGGDDVYSSLVASSTPEPGSHDLRLRDTQEVDQKAVEASAKDAEVLLADITIGNSTTGTPSAIITPPSALDAAANSPLVTNDNGAKLPDFAHTKYMPILQQAPGKSTTKQFMGDSRASLGSNSSISALTDISGISSKPPSVSSKATTPFEADSPREALGDFASGSAFHPRSMASRIQFNVRPKVSIPTDLTPQEYAMECIEAAENSRLHAYALHQEEYQMLRAHLSHGQVSTYLNVRNGILRLWARNPQIAVTREEAIGCAKDTRWFDVANVCFDWLVRRGFINYGSVEIRQSKNHANHTQPRKRKTVVVIGAGFSGLGCARQLEGLFMQYSKRFRDMGEEPPRIVVLEGRNRVGGRVYSRAFETLPATASGVMRGRRFTAEMGGMIITGFERGNPLNILVRGQLGLPYHCLLADMSLHDSNGTNVDLQRDTLVEQLYNVCLERVSEYKFKTKPPKLIEGNRDLMDEGRDSTAEGHKTIALIEETTTAQPHAPPVSEQNVAPRVDLVPVSTNRMIGKVHAEPGTAGSTKAAVQAKQIGWTLKAGVTEAKDIDLDPAISDPNSTLGSVLDNALMQHKEILDLNAQDFRLFNWHIANLEYSNATNLNRLSSRGWDVDVGNEWDGRHTMVVGGYQSVARGLATLPAPLEIQHKAAVKRIRYSPDGLPGAAKITLEDGKSIDADYVVNTIPLGVLKHGNVEFQPPLPTWKTQAIERLGFGVLNKVILVYKEAFWDKDRDIFGMLQTPTNRSSLNQKDYAARRGRFFQWFSVTNTTGMPCLLALMAGDAAYDTEITPNDELIAEATEVLRMRYGARVTQPLEAIVTRWESDRFARGSYSNAGVNMQPEDYQLMARSLGNLYFAGEHTIVTHPATVHGAYLSGLRAASDVLESMLGPIEIPTPLILPRETAASLKRKAQEEHRDPKRARLEAYEMEINEHILATLGPYPLKPAKVAGNPYILFNKANYEEGRKRCEEGRRAGKGKPGPNEVRTMTSKMWKESSTEVRKPFEDAADQQKQGFALAMQSWGEAATKWERDAVALREKFVKEHPSVPGLGEVGGTSSDTWSGARRAKRMVESYREADSDVDMD